MASILTDEGLTFLEAVMLGQSSAPSGGYWIGLFTSQTATTVQSRAGTMAGLTEPTGGGYVRIQIASGSWGAATVTGTGVRRTGAQMSFPETTAPYSPTTVNGYFIATASTGGTLIAQSNFTGGARPVDSEGIVNRVTPVLEFRTV